MTDLTTSAAQAILKDVQNKRSNLSAKLTAGENEHISLTPQLDQATANLAVIEKQHILDQATDQELFEAQQAHADLAAKLAAVNRRIQLIREAIEEVETKIAAAAQNLKIARRDFCIEESFRDLEKINKNKEFRALILEAMAAHAANGQFHYTNNARKFMIDNIERILPAITEAEVRDATKRFQKMNDLD